MTAFALLRRPPPFGWCRAGADRLRGTAPARGVFVLRLRVFADAVVRGPRDARGVALTFDDGPHPRWTPRVLDLLSRARRTRDLLRRRPEGRRAPGDRARHPRRRARRRACTRTPTTVSSRCAASAGCATIWSAESRRSSASTGRRPVLFRPPIGHTNPTIARVADSLGLIVVGWTVGGRDGVPRARPRARRRPRAPRPSRRSHRPPSRRARERRPRAGGGACALGGNPGRDRGQSGSRSSPLRAGSTPGALQSRGDGSTT